MAKQEKLLMMLVILPMLTGGKNPLSGLFGGFGGGGTTQVVTTPAEAFVAYEPPVLATTPAAPTPKIDPVHFAPSVVPGDSEYVVPAPAIIAPTYKAPTYTAPVYVAPTQSSPYQRSGYESIDNNERPPEAEPVVALGSRFDPYARGGGDYGL